MTSTLERLYAHSHEIKFKPTVAELFLAIGKFRGEVRVAQF
jgi:hypothetical protein